MLQTLHDNLESFEAINQDGVTRDLVLRMSALDDVTKGTLAEIASDQNFLLAVEDYLVRTEIAH
jgi:hypothetical protein